jgi:hypothetical protein
MNFKSTIFIIKTTVQVILLFFGLFGGFLLNIAPPEYESNLKFAIGFAQFISLVIFIFISVFLHIYGKKNVKRSALVVKIWMSIAAVFIIIFIFWATKYQSIFNRLTIWQSKWEMRFIRGEALTDDAKQVCSDEKQRASNCENFLLYRYYNSDEIAYQNALWTENSVQRSRNILFTNYIILIIALSGGLFSLVEIIAARSPGAQKQKTTRTSKLVKLEPIKDN